MLQQQLYYLADLIEKLEHPKQSDWSKEANLKYSKIWTLLWMFKFFNQVFWQIIAVPMRPLWFGLALCAPFIDQLRHYLKKKVLVAGQIILRVGGINGFSDVNMWRAVVWLGLICNLANSAEIRPEYFPGLKQNGVKAVSIRVIRIVGFQEGGWGWN